MPAGSRPLIILFGGLVILFGGLVAPTLLAALIAIATYWLSERTRTEEDWVQHTLAVRNQTLTVNALMRRANPGSAAISLPAAIYGGVLDAGVQFISKPFTIEQLGDKVRQVLDR